MKKQLNAFAVCHTGNTLEGDVSDVIALDQLTSPFSPRKATKIVALIFRKIRCFNIHFNIHTCHQLVFDLGRSSTRYLSGLHKKIDTWQRTRLGRQLMFSREKLEGFAERMRNATICESRAHSAYKPNS